MVVSAAEFARLAKVSKVAVSKAPPLKIHKEPDGKIDTDNPINAKYLAEHTGATTPPKTKAPRYVEPKADAPLPTSEDALKKTIADLMGESVDLDRQKKVADIALKVTTEKVKALDLAKRKGEILDRAIFQRVASDWDEKLNQNVMRVPRRVISRLWSMAKAGDEPRKGEDFLERELSKAVTRALEGVAVVR